MGNDYDAGYRLGYFDAKQGGENWAGNRTKSRQFRYGYSDGLFDGSEQEKVF